MTDRTEPRKVPEDDLDVVQGGGRVPAHTPEWTNRAEGDPGYIGETEKNVWKAPAGTEASLTHDVQFEHWAKRR